MSLRGIETGERMDVLILIRLPHRHRLLQPSHLLLETRVDASETNTKGYKLKLFKMN